MNLGYFVAVVFGSLTLYCVFDDYKKNDKEIIYNDCCYGSNCRCSMLGFAYCVLQIER